MVGAGCVVSATDIGVFKKTKALLETKIKLNSSNNATYTTIRYTTDIIKCKPKCIANFTPYTIA